MSLVNPQVQVQAQYRCSFHVKFNSNDDDDDDGTETNTDRGQKTATEVRMAPPQEERTSETDRIEGEVAGLQEIDELFSLPEPQHLVERKELINQLKDAAARKPHVSDTTPI